MRPNVKMNQRRLFLRIRAYGIIDRWLIARPPPSVPSSDVRPSGSVKSRPLAIRECQERGWCVVNDAYEVRRPIGRVDEKVVGNAFEIVSRLLGPAKLHQRRGGFVPESRAESDQAQAA